MPIVRRGWCAVVAIVAIPSDWSVIDFLQTYYILRLIYFTQFVFPHSIFIFITNYFVVCVCVRKRLVLNGFQLWKLYWAWIWILLFGANGSQMEMNKLGSVCLLKWIERNAELTQES